MHINIWSRCDVDDTFVQLQYQRSLLLIFSGRTLWFVMAAVALREFLVKIGDGRDETCVCLVGFFYWDGSCIVHPSGLLMKLSLFWGTTKSWA